MSFAEIDQTAMESRFVWCVYMHKRPDGSVFYIGKGKPGRAYDFSPSRRTAWHRNIVAKHGRANIGVQVVPCCTEQEAFELERAHIAIARLRGDSLANLTDGGEGCSGRAVSEKQLAGLAKGRRSGKRGVPGVRPDLRAWIASPAGAEHVKALSLLGAKVLHQERRLVCVECGGAFVTKSAKAKCCSRKCEQRYRRAGKNR